MRVSVHNCVSTAYEMLRFSSDAILANAGTEDFDYVIVHWLASPKVRDYLEDLKAKHENVTLVEYKTNNDVGYVPNIRGMMNTGFDKGFELNDYCGLVNTDQYFGKDWLVNLAKHATPNTIVNSVHISPIVGTHVVRANLGIPEYGRFNMAGFNEIYDRVYKDVLETEEQRGGWISCSTMPYLIPKRLWEIAGPWELEPVMTGKAYRTPTVPLGTEHKFPDRRFFQRCKDAGAMFTMSHSSITYHHEGVERTGKRPPGAEHLR